MRPSAAGKLTLDFRKRYRMRMVEFVDLLRVHWMPTIGPPTLYRWERGGQYASPMYMAALGRALDEMAVEIERRCREGCLSGDHPSLVAVVERLKRGKGVAR